MEKQSQTIKKIIETEKCIYLEENNKRKLLAVYKKAIDEKGDFFKIYTRILELNQELSKEFHNILFKKMGV